MTYQFSEHGHIEHAAIQEGIKTIEGVCQLAA